MKFIYFLVLFFVFVLFLCKLFFVVFVFFVSGRLQHYLFPQHCNVSCVFTICLYINGQHLFSLLPTSRGCLHLCISGQLYDLFSLLPIYVLGCLHLFLSGQLYHLFPFSPCPLGVYISLLPRVPNPQYESNQHIAIKIKLQRAQFNEAFKERCFCNVFSRHNMHLCTCTSFSCSAPIICGVFASTYGNCSM